MEKKKYFDTKDFENFASNISHELNNPLSVIVSCCELFDIFSDDEFNPKSVRELSHRMYAAAERMENTIKSFRKIAKESNNLVLQPISVKNLYEKNIKEILGKYTKVNRSIDIESGCKNEFVYVDAKKISKIIDIILINAIEAIENAKTQNPEIRLVVLHKNNKVRLQFWNNGPQIKESELDEIFDIYYSTKQHQKEIKGIGLSYAMYIIKSHGGDLRAASSKEKTVFEIDLPFANSEQKLSL